MVKSSESTEETTKIFRHKSPRAKFLWMVMKPEGTYLLNSSQNIWWVPHPRYPENAYEYRLVTQDSEKILFMKYWLRARKSHF